MIGMKMNVNVGVGLVLTLMTLKVQAHIALWDEAMYGCAPFIQRNDLVLMIDGTNPILTNTNPSFPLNDSHSINGGSTTISINLQLPVKS